MARAYDASYGRVEPLRALAIESVALPTAEPVLDIACGTGSTVVTLVRQVEPVGHVLGIEWYPAMSDIARQRSCDAVIESHSERVNEQNEQRR